MNLKSFLFPLVLLLFAFVKMDAQNDVKWLNEQNPVKTGLPSDIKTLKTDASHIYYLLYPVDNSIFSGTNLTNVLHGVKALELHKFDLKSQKDSVLIYKPKSRTFVQIIEVGNIYHIISYFKNKTQKKIFVFDETFNLENLQLNNDAKMLSVIDYTENGASNIYDFSLNIINENNRFLFNYSYTLSKQNCYRFEVYNNQLKLEWSKNKDFATAGQGDNYENNHVLDKDGNIYAVQKNYDKSSKKDKYYLVYYPKDGTQPKLLALEMKLDNQLLDQKLSVNKNNELICSGLYANVKETSAVGAFSFVVTSKLENIKSKDFSSIDRISNITGLDDETKKVLNNKEILKGKQENKYQYDLKDIHYRKDGGYDLVAEKYISFSITVTISSPNGGGSSTTTYYQIYDDIIVLNCDSNGLFKRVQCIPKHQYLVDDQKYAGSFLLNYGKNDEMNFIFNLTDTSPNKLFPKLHKNSRTVMISLDSVGQGSIRELFKDFECSNSFLPVLSASAGENKAILFKCSNLVSKGFIALKKFGIVFGELDIK